MTATCRYDLWVGSDLGLLKGKTYFRFFYSYVLILMLVCIVGHFCAGYKILKVSFSFPVISS